MNNYKLETMGKPPATQNSLVLLTPVCLEVSLPAWIPRRRYLGGRAVESCPPPNSGDNLEVHKPHLGVQLVLFGSCSIYLKDVGILCQYLSIGRFSIKISWRPTQQLFNIASCTAGCGQMMVGTGDTGNSDGFCWWNKYLSFLALRWATQQHILCLFLGPQVAGSPVVSAQVHPDWASFACLSLPFPLPSSHFQESSCKSSACTQSLSGVGEFNPRHVLPTPSPVLPFYQPLALPGQFLRALSTPTNQSLCKDGLPQRSKWPLHSGKYWVK